MEEYISKAMSEDILDSAAHLYNTTKSDIVSIGGFENFVYEFNLGDNSYIMRFVHSGHREYTQVQAEIEFIDYLDKNKARVSTVIHSINNNLVEKISINTQHYFCVCVFEKAPGGKVEKSDLTDDFYIMFGREVGRLHKLTKNYKPINKRIKWNEENILKNGEKFLPKKDRKIIDILNNLVQKIAKLSINIDNFGLIHTDLHFGNMFIYGGELTFFDWDDASYKHFISDIAIVIFYHFVYSKDTEDEINTKAHRILALFLKGYSTENSFDYESLVHLNDFLKLRMIILYIAIFAMSEEMDKSGFRKFYSDKYRDKILNKTPFLDLNIVIKDL